MLGVVQKTSSLGAQESVNLRIYGAIETDFAHECMLKLTNMCSENKLAVQKTLRR